MKLYFLLPLDINTYYLFLVLFGENECPLILHYLQVGTLPSRIQFNFDILLERRLQDIKQFLISSCNIMFEYVLSDAIRN